MSMRLAKLYQISGFLLLVAMLFAGFSIYSYAPEDPAWNQYVSDGEERVQNLGGAVGAALADIGLQGLGSSVVLLLGIGAWVGWSLMHQRLQRAAEVVCRGLILVAAVSTGTHIIFGQDPVFGPAFLAGGVSGQWLAAICLNYFNTFGALLIALAAVILALFVGVDFSIRSIWHRQGERHLMQLPDWFRCCYAYPQRGFAWLRNAIGRLMSAGQQAWQWLLQWLDDGAGDEPVERPAAVDPSFVDTFNGDWDIDDDDDEDEDEEIEAGPTGGRPVTVPARVPRSRLTVQPAIDVTPAEPAARRGIKRRRGHEPGRLPSLALLDEPQPHTQRQAVEELEEQARFLEEKLSDFGITGEVVHVQQGPVITMFEYAPASGIKVSRIVNLQDDLALVLRALSVRVVAPIPGKAAVGIEVPNKHREIVRLREVLDSDVLPGTASKLSLALGRDITGAPFVTDLAKTPHLLIAGATGAGKSVGLNCMICSMLFRATPEEVRLIMIDPKMLELSIYEGVPHLLVPVVTHPKQAALALRRVVEEMERRYQLLAAKGVRNIAQYNDALDDEAASGRALGRPVEADVEDGLVEEKLPFLVVVIDELSDLMMVSSKEVEDSLTRIAQMARAAGIHLIVATQRPSVDVLTGVIKANFPARLSFQVTSKTDSRTILDANGAEKLLGRGDMLFLAPGTSKPQRVHSAFVSEAEINRLVAAWKSIDQPQYDERFLVPSEEPTGADGQETEYDEKYDEAVALVAATGQASISMVQRRLRVGYNRAARMIEIMEKEGLVGPSDGVKPREVLVRKNYDFDGS